MSTEVVHGDIWEGESPIGDDGLDIIDAVVLPDVGDDLSPTTEQILAGRIGNGKWDSLTPELAKTFAAERREMGRQIKVSRREAYEEGMRDALGQIADFETGIINLGSALMERLQLGEALSQRELDTLKLAQKTAIEMKDRAIGKPKTVAEVTTQKSILHLIAGIDIGS
jgi:hypothetical protein